MSVGGSEAPTRARARRSRRRRATVAEKRRGALPSEPNAGSVFKNPPGDYAGRLIEACGLKGERRGGAAISAAPRERDREHRAAPRPPTCSLLMRRDARRRAGAVRRYPVLPKWSYWG